MMSHVKASIVLFVRNQVSVRYAIYIFGPLFQNLFLTHPPVGGIIGPKTLFLSIDFIYDTRHLCTRFRMDGIKVVSRGFSGANKC